MLNDAPAVPENRILIDGDHGYRIDGDRIHLNAHLILTQDSAYRSAYQKQWALQLWACDHPYSGDALDGIKVAEVRVALPPPHDGPQIHVEGDALATIPIGRRPYAMVLVLASGRLGAFEHVQDFANYPDAQTFAVPHIDGPVGYAMDGDSIVLRAHRVYNPRPFGSLSGSMALELWGAPEGHTGPADDVVLARADLGQVSGQSSIENVEQRVALSRPAVGRWRLTMVLREWTAAGFAVRDRSPFSVLFWGNAADPVVPEPLSVRSPPSVRAPVSVRSAASAASPASPAAAPDEARSGNGVDSVHVARDVSHDEIALAAYLRYVARGCSPEGDLQDWLDAERELRQARTAAPAA